MNIYHPELNSVRCVIFDLDGTLYNKHGFVTYVIAAMAGSWSYLIRERIVRRRLAGLHYGSREAFRNAFFGNNARFERWYDEKYMPAQVSILERHFHSVEWARELITELRRRDCKLVVYSDYDVVPEKLRALGYSLYDFDLIVSAGDMGGLKPAAESARAIIEKLGVRADQCLFVGDRDKTDGATARAVGAHFLQIKNR